MSQRSKKLSAELGAMRLEDQYKMIQDNSGTDRQHRAILKHWPKIKKQLGQTHNINPKRYENQCRVILHHYNLHNRRIGVLQAMHFNDIGQEENRNWNYEIEIDPKILEIYGMVDQVEEREPEVDLPDSDDYNEAEEEIEEEAEVDELFDDLIISLAVILMAKMELQPKRFNIYNEGWDFVTVVTDVGVGRINFVAAALTWREDFK